MVGEFEGAVPAPDSTCDGVAQVVEVCSQQARVVLVAGIPGVGKSLLLKEVAQSAHRHGRRVTCLQWDVVRGPFESCELGQCYPEVDGVTHPLIRVAAGLWSRTAIAEWMASAPSDDFLVGELPLVGNRLMEVVRPAQDSAETHLTSRDVRFLVPVPSVELRKVIELARDRSAAAPGHERERADASPKVLQALWAEVAQVAAGLGLEGATGTDISRTATDTADRPRHDAHEAQSYRPGVYQALYEYLLVHRRATVLRMTAVRSSPGSVYDIAGAPEDLAPSLSEANDILSSVRARFSDEEINRRSSQWWELGPSLEQIGGPGLEVRSVIPQAHLDKTRKGS